MYMLAKTGVKDVLSKTGLCSSGLLCKCKYKYNRKCKCKKYINENTKTWLEGTLVQSWNLFRWPEPLRKHPRQLLRRLRSQNVTIVMSGKYRVRLNFRFFYFSGCITIVYIFYQYEFIHSYLWKKYICHHHQHHNHEHNYED